MAFRYLEKYIFSPFIYIYIYVNHESEDWYYWSLGHHDIHLEVLYSCLPRCFMFQNSTWWKFSKRKKREGKERHKEHKLIYSLWNIMLFLFPFEHFWLSWVLCNSPALSLFIESCSWNNITSIAISTFYNPSKSHQMLFVSFFCNNSR